MFATFLTPAYVPFALALGLLVALLMLEVLVQLVGGSLLGGDAPEIDAGIESSFDFDPGAEPDVAALVDMADADVPAPSGGDASIASSLLGLGKAPTMIWVASVLTGFGVTGLVVQGAASAVFGAPLPGLVASIPAAIVAFGFARAFAGVFARLVPATETTATRVQFMGGLRGYVSQGVARRGSPAEVRLRDRHGNTHYLRCEPFADADVIPEGTAVLTLRQRRGPDDWELRIVATE